MKEKNELFKEIQSNGFAMYDFLLYLDTHPKDKTAFKMFKDLGEKQEALICEYTSNYGPLTPFCTAKRPSFDWLNSPWPWERPHDVKCDAAQCPCKEKGGM
ncbi:MAG: spore coat protein CotJB [Clostridiales bacterium]|nr:spore coat protein CotJB [Clostridiales bacterium]